VAPQLKDALYQMMFEELEQRDLKKTPEYRNVMLRADQHAEWLAGPLTAEPVLRSLRDDIEASGNGAFSPSANRSNAS
jgi:hypothetical protein